MHFAEEVGNETDIFELTRAASSEQPLTEADEVEEEKVTSSPSVARIIVCTLLLVVVVVTVVGNLVVLLAPIVERKLRNSLTYLIMNLAITDLLVAVMAMSFYTFDVLLGESGSSYSL